MFNPAVTEQFARMTARRMSANFPKDRYGMNRFQAMPQSNVGPVTLFRVYEIDEYGRAHLV